MLLEFGFEHFTHYFCFIKSAMRYRTLVLLRPPVHHTRMTWLDTQLSPQVVKTNALVFAIEYKKKVLRQLRSTASCLSQTLNIQMNSKD